MTVVAWVSRHKPLPVQIQQLKEKLGNNTEIVYIGRVFRDARDVYWDIKSVGAQYAVVVLPLSMVSALTQYKDIEWLWAEMETVHINCRGELCPEYNPDSDAILKSFDTVRHLRFKEFRKIVKVEMVTEPW